MKVIAVLDVADELFDGEAENTFSGEMGWVEESGSSVEDIAVLKIKGEHHYVKYEYEEV